jgi:hypothetical protein
VTIDVFGSDLTEVLPRAAEAISGAAGVPASMTPAPPFRVELHAPTTVELVTTLASTLLGMYEEQGRYVSVSSCRSVMTVADGGTLPPGIACVLVCQGGHVDSRHDAGLRRLHLEPAGAGVWEEDGILRARFHVAVEVQDDTPSGAAGA